MMDAREIKSVFYGDIREKKSAGHSARRRRSGSRTAYVSLPSDHKTKKELERMNGEVKSYKLSEPMTFQEFRDMPADLRRQYTAFLAHTYGATMSVIAEAFGVSISTFRRSVADCDLSGLFTCGSRMTNGQRILLMNFFHPGQEPAPQPQEDPRPAQETVPLSLEEFSLRFRGAFDADHVANSLRRLARQGQSVSLHIRCELLEDVL